MIEHHDLCKNYTYHKIKIAFFFAAMRHYKDDLVQHGYTVIYEPYKDFAGSYIRVEAPESKGDQRPLSDIVDFNIKQKFFK